MSELGEPGAKTAAVEDVVAQNQGNRLIPHEIRTEHESLRDALRACLDRVFRAEAPLAAVAEQAVERGLVAGRGDDQDFADADHDQGGNRK
jgi:hypothetical protein